MEVYPSEPSVFNAPDLCRWLLVSQLIAGVWPQGCRRDPGIDS